LLANSSWLDANVINAVDGTHQHPTQALLDAYTLRKHLRENQGDLKGVKIALVGDVLHSRVARSNVWLLASLGAEVTLVAPPTLLPVGVEKWPCRVSYDFDEAIAGKDAVMMLRVQQERMNAAFFPSTQEYSRRFGLNRERMNSLSANGIVLHPGPMNRGLEISADVADSERSVIVEQVANGVSVRMAVLYLLLGGAEVSGVNQ
jgi:aspartate carbamoyltransferase catalytic subunit